MDQLVSLLNCVDCDAVVTNEGTVCTWTVQSYKFSSCT